MDDSKYKQAELAHGAHCATIEVAGDGEKLSAENAHGWEPTSESGQVKDWMDSSNHEILCVDTSL